MVVAAVVAVASASSAVLRSRLSLVATSKMLFVDRSVEDSSASRSDVVSSVLKGATVVVVVDVIGGAVGVAYAVEGTVGSVVDARVVASVVASRVVDSISTAFAVAAVLSIIKSISVSASISPKISAADFISKLSKCAFAMPSSVLSGAGVVVGTVGRGVVRACCQL